MVQLFGWGNSKSQLLAGWAKIIHPRLKDLSDRYKETLRFIMDQWS